MMQSLLTERFNLAVHWKWSISMAMNSSMTVNTIAATFAKKNSV